MNEASSPNAQQIAFWNGQSGRTWVEFSDLLDLHMANLARHTLDVLAPRPGERMLDVGCGCGRTTLQIAERIGADGLVMGVDISRPMLEVAAKRAADAALPQVRFAEADAQVYGFESAAFDGIYSRGGMTFFADPVAAFVNLRRALKPGGRLTFVCFRSVAENPVLTTPLTAARHRLPPVAPPDPNVPGTFSFADGERARRVLEAAGFSGIAVTPHDAQVGGYSLEGAVEIALRIGPLGTALRKHPDLAPEVRGDVRAALLPYVRDGKVWQSTATWVVTAYNPPPTIERN